MKTYDPKQTLEATAQKDRSGCGVACVAILAGKPYDLVRRHYLEMGNAPDKEARLRAVGSGAGMTDGEMVDLMAAFKIPPYIAKTGPLVFRIEGPPGHGDHLVVIAADGTIFDPARALPIESCAGCNEDCQTKTQRLEAENASLRLALEDLLRNAGDIPLHYIKAAKEALGE